MINYIKYYLKNKIGTSFFFPKGKCVLMISFQEISNRIRNSASIFDNLSSVEKKKPIHF